MESAALPGGRTQPIVRAERTAAVAIGMTVLLVALKAAVGLATGAAVLIADAVHSAADLFALGASWIGLRLARRSPTSRFPFGFYRAETLATLMVAGVIIYLGITLMLDAAVSFGRVPRATDTWLAMGTALLSAASGAFLAIWEKRVSRAAGSGSLAAAADEAAMDAVSSLIVFVALLASVYAIPYVTGAATILISLAVLRVGVYHGWLALLTLMDASVDPDLEASVTEELRKIPEVRNVHKLRSRRSGPCFFIEGHLLVAGSMDVMRSHSISHYAQSVIRREFPRVEAMILHMEPYLAAQRRMLVPVDSDEGLTATVSERFGRAPYILVATVETERVVDWHVHENPMRIHRSRVGLSVVNRFVRRQDPTVALVREIGEIAYHAMRDSSVEVFRTAEMEAEDAILAYLSGAGDLLIEPTRLLDELPDDAL